MRSLPCRECGTPVSADLNECPACRCRAPFGCDVCGSAVSALSLGMRVSHYHPYGSYSEDGMPLCHRHRRTRCHRCGEIFFRDDTTITVIGKVADTVLREGMPPRVEEATAPFCRNCIAASERAWWRWR
jgi:hypothetical protein